MAHPRRERTAAYQVSAAGGVSGSVAWSGYSDAGASLAAAGLYTFELEAYREGMLLAASEPVSFALYTLRLQPVARVSGPNGIQVRGDGPESGPGELPPDREKACQCQEAVRIAPEKGMARYALAHDLVRTGNTSEGARQLVAAVERFTPPELNDYGWQAAAELRRLGFEREAAKVDAAIKSRASGAR